MGLRAIAVLMAALAGACAARKQTPPPQPYPYPYYPHPYPSPPPPPGPGPAPTPAPELTPEPQVTPAPPAGPVIERNTVRQSFGGGVSGTLSPNHDVKWILGWEAQISRRIGGRVSYGMHTHLSLRNWNVIGDFYSSLDGCHGKECAYGYIFGWLAGTGLLGIGPDITISTPARTKPWFSFGTTFLLHIDTRDVMDDDGVFAHGLFAAAGVSSGGTGLSVRVHYAPEDGLLIGSDTTPVLGAMVTLDVEKPLRKKSAKKAD